MLHEILLSLSGHPSPLLRPPKEAKSSQDSGSFVDLSPSETALLSSLAHLSNLHLNLTAHTATISTSHHSTVCRAVSTAITSIYLHRFQKKVLEVESRILQKDANLVGGYGIVPLSGLVSEFGPWTRTMEWLWEIACVILAPEDFERSQEQARPNVVKKGSTGAALINRLRNEAHTGYPDIGKAANTLIAAAETAWLRQLSTWVLYGRLPEFGGPDFFIQENEIDDEYETAGWQGARFSIRPEMLPNFVDSSTAASILFIGQSLNHIRIRGETASKQSSSLRSSELALLPVHLRYLSGLSTPVSTSNLSNSISAIRFSLSKHTLHQVFPLEKIVEILSLLREFFLLGRGEFALSLISEADEGIRSRWRRPGQQEQGREGLRAVVIKESEVTAVLARTWVSLSTYRKEEDMQDETFDLAHDLLRLSLTKANTSKTRNHCLSSGIDQIAIPETTFSDMLLSVPTTLSLAVPSPLDLFLTPNDLDVYAYINAYLLSIRRAHLRLTDLWKLSSIRRNHPAPLGPPGSNSKLGQRTVRKKRMRANDRARTMRRVWATSSAAIFLLAEVGGYFQGEVVKGSWDSLRTWLQAPLTVGTDEDHMQDVDRESSRGVRRARDLWTSAGSPRPQSRDKVVIANPGSHDPETVSRAHQVYLRGLLDSLFLTDAPFPKILRLFLQHIDHLASCVTRLQHIWQNLDLETDDGVMDAFSNFRVEQVEALKEMEDVGKNIEVGIRNIVTRLRELDSERIGVERGPGNVLEQGEYQTWRVGGVDRLLMKLDFGSLMSSAGLEVDAG
ncbi:MAG: hypothetical protein M1824_001780 [Vezdaea acicularis]|nr:MAG: hypothetical protein M1824_001780 [Vezdaea acicularis]